MKRSKRGFWILAMVCVIVGGCLLGAGFGLGGKLHSGWGINFGRPFGIGVHSANTTNMDKNISVDDFDSIDIDLAIGDIEIKQGDDYGLIIKDIPDEDYKVFQENKTLKIDYERNYSFFNFNFGAVDYKVTIIVPKGVELDSVKVDSSMGDVTLSDIACKELVVDQAMGDVDLLNMNVKGDVKVDQSMGDITFEGILHGEGDFDNSMGEIDIKIMEAMSDYQYDLDTSMGNIRLKDAKQSDKSDSEMRGGSSNAPYQIIANNTMGNIVVEFDAK